MFEWIPKRTLWTAVACTFSGVVSGVFISGKVPGFDFLNPYTVAAGVLFGVAFAVANFTSVLRAVGYVVASTVIYYGATQVCYGLLSLNLANGAYVVAGASGGFSVAVSTKLISGMPFRFRDELRTTLLGAALGWLFSWVCPIGAPWRDYMYGYAYWQVPIGVSLSWGIRERSAVKLIAAQ